MNKCIRSLGLFSLCCHSRITKEELTEIHLSEMQILPLPGPRVFGELSEQKEQVASGLR